LEEPAVPARPRVRDRGEGPETLGQAGGLRVDHPGGDLVPVGVSGLLAGGQALPHLVAEPPVELGQAGRDPALALLSAASGRLCRPGGTTPRTPLGPARLIGQEPAQSGGPAASSGTEPSDQSSSSASTCLHGNFRLGHEHRYAGPDRSTTVRYGAAALPRHSPHTASAPAAAPVAGQARSDASDSAVRCDGASGASASTRSRSQRSATLETLACGTDIRRGFGAG